MPPRYCQSWALVTDVPDVLLLAPSPAEKVQPARKSSAFTVRGTGGPSREAVAGS